MKCRLCGSESVCSIGSPAYRQPPKIAGEAVYVEDLELDLKQCSECRYYFISPLIPAERINQCYEKASNQWTTDQAVAVSRSYIKKNELISKLSSGGNTVLNVGCYDGGFDEFLGAEYERFGVEPSLSAAEEARRRGVDVIGSTLQEIDLAEFRFDIITLFDVAEHLANPIDDFRRLKSMLSDNGIIMFETGDMDAFSWKRLMTLNPYIALYEHVGFFNYESVVKLAEILDLKVVYFEQTVHTTISFLEKVKRKIKIAVYFSIRTLGILRFPLSAGLKNIFNGPVPVPPKTKDHFLAILKKR